MAKVYIVTAADYDSCWHLVAFSTREAAEAFQQQVQAVEDTKGFGGDSASVYEIRLDPSAEEMPGSWIVHLDDAGLHVSGSPYRTWLFAAADPAEIVTFSQRNFWGYGATAEAAHESADQLRRQTLALEGRVMA